MSAPKTPEALRQAAAARAMCASGEARAIREDARITLRELAAIVGVDHKALARWENGVWAPTFDHAVAYFAALEALRDVEEPAHV